MCKWKFFQAGYLLDYPPIMPETEELYITLITVNVATKLMNSLYSCGLARWVLQGHAI